MTGVGTPCLSGVLNMAKKATFVSISYWLPGFEPEADPASTPASPGHQPGHQPVPVLAHVAAIPRDETIEVAAPRVQSWRLTVVESDGAIRETFPRLHPADLEGLGSAVAKFDANVRAIEVLARVEAENRSADKDERLAMVRYTGWGSLPAAFNLV